jgi:hypothetical protein
MSYPLHIRLPALLGLGACLSYLPCARAALDSDDVTAVSSRVSATYSREKLPDGSPKPESYAYAEGGLSTGGIRDDTIDRLKFMDVASTIAVPLANRNYLPTRDAKSTRLLIVVYWGRTSTPGRSEDSMAIQQLQDAAGSASSAKSSNTQQVVAATTMLNTPPGGTAMACGHFEPNLTSEQTAEQIDTDNSLTGAMAMVAAENRSRDHVDAQIAALLGYDSWWSETEGLKGTPREYRRQDMINELENDRYYVVLMAYDFQKMWKQKKHDLLWETRFSVRQRGHDFDKQLTAMTIEASRYFGRDSHGLVHESAPVGHVELGDLKTLGTVAEK